MDLNKYIGIYFLFYFLGRNHQFKGYFTNGREEYRVPEEYCVV